jgi:hypothetical protein
MFKNKKQKEENFNLEEFKLTDPRLFEKDFINIGKHLEFVNPQSTEEIEKELQKLLNKDISKTLQKPKDKLTDFDIAYDYVYKALESDKPNKKIELAQKALNICPDVIEAYNIIAENTKGLDNKKELYEKAISQGKNYFGDEFFKENKGNFWGIIETRPYIRAMMGYSEILWLLEEEEKSISVLFEIIEYNPSDNMGARYPLISNLLLSKKLKDAINLLDKYKNDCSIHWNYSFALYFFFKNDKIFANKYLKKAFDENPYFPAFLFGVKKLPKTNSNYISIGGEEEALEYLIFAAPVWQRYKEASDWLMKEYAKQFIDPVDGHLKLPEKDEDEDENEE